MSAITISIVSDVVCPWCYIGLTELQRAIAKFRASHPEAAFKLSWHAFELNPEFPPAVSDPAPVVPRADFYAAKFGSPELAAQRLALLSQRADRLGIKINLLEGVLGSTKLVHEAVAYAGEKDRQTELMVALFEATFGRGENIFGRSELARIADGVEGLSGSELAEYLELGRGRKLVESEARTNRDIGGVPHYVFNNRYEVHGGQDADTFVRFLEASSR